MAKVHLADILAGARSGLHLDGLAGGWLGLKVCGSLFRQTEEAGRPCERRDGMDVQTRTSGREFGRVVP